MPPDPLAAVESRATPAPKDAQQEIKRLDGLIQQITTELNKLGAIEGEVKTELNYRIWLLENQKASVNIPFPRIDLACFQWRDNQGFPAFALFDRDHPTFNLKYRHPEFLPGIIRQHLDSFLQQPDKHPNVKLFVEFKGKLPKEIDDRMAELKPQFDKLLIMAHVLNWETNLVRKEHLLVGFKNNMLFLITKFEPIPANEYITSKFPDL